MATPSLLLRLLDASLRGWFGCCFLRLHGSSAILLIRHFAFAFNRRRSLEAMLNDPALMGGSDFTIRIWKPNGLREFDWEEAPSTILENYAKTDAIASAILYARVRTEHYKGKTPAARRRWKRLTKQPDKVKGDYDNCVQGDWWHAEVRAMKHLDKRHPATGAMRGLLVAATHKRTKIWSTKNRQRMLGRGWSLAEASRKTYDSATLQEARIKPPPEEALPELQLVLNMFPVDFPPFAASGGAIPFVKGDSAKSRAKCVNSFNALLDEYSQGRYHYCPGLVMASIRPDGKVVTHGGTNKQEGKHKHEKKAIPGNIGLRSGNGRHVHWTFYDNLRNLELNFGCQRPWHTDIELMIKVNSFDSTRYSDVVDLLRHPDTNEPFFGSGLLRRHDLMKDIPVDDSDVEYAGNAQPAAAAECPAPVASNHGPQEDDGVFQASLNAAIQGLGEDATEDYVDIAEELRSLATDYFKENRPSSRKGKPGESGTTFGTAHLLKSQRMVKLCLGLPFRTVPEAVMHRMVQSALSAAGSSQSSKLELFAQQFNKLVPPMLARGYDVSMKTPQHIEAYHKLLETNSLGYFDIIKAMGDKGKSFLDLRGKLTAVTSKEPPVATVCARKRVQPSAAPLVAQALPPAAIAATAAPNPAVTKRKRSKHTRNVEGQLCYRNDLHPPELQIVLAKGTYTGSLAPAHPGTGNWHTAGYCPWTDAEPPARARSKASRNAYERGTQQASRAKRKAQPHPDAQ